MFVIKHPHTTEGTIEKTVEKEVENEKKKEKAAEKPVEKEKEKVVEKPEGDKTETGAAIAIAHEKAQGPEVVHVTGLDQPLHEKEKEATRGKGPEVVKPTKLVLVDAPTQTVQETRGDAPHHPPWSLKQKDTFLEFAPCRDWYLNSFPPGELNRQRARTHDGLYHAYVVREANTRAASHQIVREWSTMVKERGDWVKYRDRLLRQVKDFEKMKAALAEEKAAFEAEKKYEEWGREGLRSKLRAAEELLSKERADWKEVCKKDNQRMYAARAKITDLEAQIATLTKKVEDVGVDKERVEGQRLGRQGRGNHRVEASFA
ncbi:hypothetical protein Hanom_Chr09g00825301 [Helianthus anomalus]